MTDRDGCTPLFMAFVFAIAYLAYCWLDGRRKRPAVIGPIVRPDWGCLFDYRDWDNL